MNKKAKKYLSCDIKKDKAFGILKNLGFEVDDGSGEIDGFG